MKALVTLTLLMLSAASLAEDSRVLYRVIYTAGPGWDAGLAYDEQPRIHDHFEHIRGLFERGLLMMGGPVKGEPVAMILLRADSLEDARRLAVTDPAVVNGTVKAHIDLWDVRMSSMRVIEGGPLPRALDPDRPYRIKRIDPSAPINIEQKE